MMNTILVTDKQIKYLITNSVSKRITLVKLWLSIMVVFIHSYSRDIHFVTGNIVFITPEWLETFKYLVSQSISRCAVPAFFLISAVFLYRKRFSYIENIKKKTKSLFLPYLLLNTIWIGIYFTFQHISFLSNYFSNSANIVTNWGIVEWLKAYGLFSPEILPILYPLWFVRNLIVLNILSPLLKKIFDFIPRLSLLILTLIWIVPNSFLDSYTKQSICFWGFGYFIVYYNISMEILDNDKAKLFMLYVLLLFFDCCLRGEFSGLIIHNLVCVIGIIFWFTCATNITGKVKNVLLYIASFNFSIYIFHEMTLTTLKKIIVKNFPTTEIYQLLEYIFIPFMVIVLCIIVSVILKSYCPFIYGIITGNRKK